MVVKTFFRDAKWALSFGECAFQLLLLLRKRACLRDKELSLVSKLGLPEVDVVCSIVNVLRRVGLIFSGQLVALLDESVCVSSKSLGGSSESVRGSKMILNKCFLNVVFSRTKYLLTNLR